MHKYTPAGKLMLGIVQELWRRDAVAATVPFIANSTGGETTPGPGIIIAFLPIRSPPMSDKALSGRISADAKTGSIGVDSAKPIRAEG